ncbi:MAG TPA: hypothetical protein RMG48_05870 [Myxococcales bacterium LLY-WYZ-16_1]|nr:hypothetical protein [Myxococcales bacterium LLY-WYZ-16_1]
MLGTSLPARLDLDDGEPLELVRVPPDPAGPGLPEAVRGAVHVDAIHDGNRIPAEYLSHAPEPAWEGLQARYATERDWGAALLAGALAGALRLEGFHRVNTARVLLDFGRFPGVTPSGAGEKERCAIHAPFDSWLTFDQRRRLLEGHYDRISADMARCIEGARIKVAVHTHDPGPDGARTRPPVTLLTQVKRPAHGAGSDRPSHALGPFDPLFPPELFQSTADRLLRARLTLTLEEHGINVSENDPEPLPLGSVEARGIVWKYFRELRQAYERAHPCRPERRSARELVWEMLSDTSLRSGTAVSLRGSIHQLRNPPPVFADQFDAALREYEAIRHHVLDHWDEWVAEAANPARRTSFLVVLVRKDILWNGTQGPFGAPRREPARQLARVLAKGIRRYFSEDRRELWDCDVRRSLPPIRLASVAD